MDLANKQLLISIYFQLFLTEISNLTLQSFSYSFTKSEMEGPGKGKNNSNVNDDKYSKISSADSELLNQNSQSKKQNPSKTKQIQKNKNYIKCRSQEDADKYCCREKCQSKCRFLCSSKQCTMCEQDHEKCNTFSQISRSYKLIKKKIFKTSKSKSQVDKIITNLIKQMNRTKDNVNKVIEMRANLVMLSKPERQFYASCEDPALNQEKISNFDGKQACDLNFFIEKNLGEENTIEKDLSDKTLKFEVDMLKFFKSYEKSIIEVVEEHEKQTQDDYKNKLQVETFQGTNFHRVQSSILSQKSSILNKVAYAKKIIQWFPSAKSVTLKFKAGDNNFVLAKFFEVCGTLTNTFIICKTDKKKIIGAFTPLAHYNGSGSDSVGNDSSSISFLFSLNTNEKWNIANYSSYYSSYYAYPTAIARYSNKSCIYFGNGEFVIQNKSNSTNCTMSLSNTYYQNSSHSASKQSYEKILGSQNSTFKTKEWQVWQVEYN